ncbi:MAG: 6-bladed beta-propeller [Candidatus Cloacimonetes bacterium]|nr:6-bladed beta-propeller [Candidatus Cloacimonadota bacterium]
MRQVILIIIIVELFMFGCNTKQEHIKIEVKNGITYVHNSKLPLSDIQLEPELIIDEGEKEEEFFAQISDLIEDKDGKIYIVDRQNHEIKVFSYEGDYLQTIGSEGKGPGEFREPLNIGFIKDSKIIISDTQNRRFQLFDKRGNFIKSYKMEVDSPGFFQIDSNKRIYNKSFFFNFGNDETENPLFNIYDIEFNKVAELGKEEKYNQPFETYVMNNCSFTIDSKDKVYVNYNVKNKILVFENNILIKEIDRELFFAPQKPSFKSENKNGTISLSAYYEPISYDIDIDSRDNIYVLTVYDNKEKEDITELENYWSIILEVFDNEGQLIYIIPIKGISPAKIHIGSDDKIYLVDSNEMKVIRYRAIF